MESPKASGSFNSRSYSRQGVMDSFFYYSYNKTAQHGNISLYLSIT